jgi:hypothetical protein
MTPQDSLERRMAALFVLALGLIAWQAPRTKPLIPPWYVTGLKPGEQVFPVAVPPQAALIPPDDPAARLTFLKRYAVDDVAPFPADACQGFVRMSAHHWLRVPLAAERLAPRPEAASTVPYHRSYRLAVNADPAAPVMEAELLSDGPGAEVEVFCP